VDEYVLEFSEIPKFLPRLVGNGIENSIWPLIKDEIAFAAGRESGADLLL